MLVKALGAGCATVVFLVVVIAAVVTAVAVFDQSLSAPAPGAATGTGSTPSPEAQQDIPAQMLVLYQAAAGNCPGLDWSVLAAIGKIETDHGRSPLPGVASGENSSGAGGPMQFLASTFDAVTTRHRLPAGGESPPSRYHPHDAVHAAAFYPVRLRRTRRPARRDIRLQPRRLVRRPGPRPGRPLPRPRTARRG